MERVLVSAQSALVVLTLAVSMSGLSIARPAQSPSIEGTQERLLIQTAMRLTRKSYDLDVCDSGLSIHLSRKRINLNNFRLTLMDAVSTFMFLFLNLKKKLHLSGKENFSFGQMHQMLYVIELARMNNNE